MACMVSNSIHPLLLAEMSPKSLTFLRSASKSLSAIHFNTDFYSSLCQHAEDVVQGGNCKVGSS